MDMNLEFITALTNVLGSMFAPEVTGVCLTMNSWHSTNSDHTWLQSWGNWVDRAGAASWRDWPSELSQRIYMLIERNAGWVMANPSLSDSNPWLDQNKPDVWNQPGSAVPRQGSTNQNRDWLIQLNLQHWPKIGSSWSVLLINRQCLVRLILGTPADSRYPLDLDWPVNVSFWSCQSLAQSTSSQDVSPPPSHTQITRG